MCPWHLTRYQIPLIPRSTASSQGLLAPLAGFSEGSSRATVASFWGFVTFCSHLDTLSSTCNKTARTRGRSFQGAEKTYERSPSNQKSLPLLQPCRNLSPTCKWHLGTCRSHPESREPSHCTSIRRCSSSVPNPKCHFSEDLPLLPRCFPCSPWADEVPVPCSFRPLDMLDYTQAVRMPWLEHNWITLVIHFIILTLFLVNVLEDFGRKNDFIAIFNGLQLSMCHLSVAPLSHTSLVLSSDIDVSKT